MDDPSYPVWHLLRTMLPVDFSVQNVSTPITRDKFIEVISSVPQHIIGKSHQFMDLDARGFSEQIGLSGISHVDTVVLKLCH